ncbi:hypothetical protein PMAYCL1PPCAC_20336, partial [Pristionchus mayeri]
LASALIFSSVDNSHRRSTEIRWGSCTADSLVPGYTCRCSEKWRIRRIIYWSSSASSSFLTRAVVVEVTSLRETFATIGLVLNAFLINIINNNVRKKEENWAKPAHFLTAVSGRPAYSYARRTRPATSPTAVWKRSLAAS